MWFRRVVGALVAACVLSVSARGTPVEPVHSLASKEKAALLDTLKTLVSMKSESRNLEGLAQAAEFIAARLKELGGRVDLLDAADVYKMEDTPEALGKMVRATFSGTGKKKILLIAHMDTVYRKGMLAGQPFRIEDNRAYGLGNRR